MPEYYHKIVIDIKTMLDSIIFQLCLIFEYCHSSKARHVNKNMFYLGYVIKTNMTV